MECLHHEHVFLGANLNTNIILIDFESVQPESLEALGHHQFKVMIFIGASQTKVPFEIATALQQMGSKAEYIKISGNGKNALDTYDFNVSQNVFNNYAASMS